MGELRLGLDRSDREIDIGYRCVMARRSPHAHHSDEVHFERKFAHDGRPRLSHNCSLLFNPLVISRSAIAYLELSVVFSPNYLAQPLTPYPLPTKDGGVLRTIGDARAYMLALPKEREWLDRWKAAYRLLVRGANAAELTRQVHLALSVDGGFDSEAFENMSASRQRPGTADTWSPDLDKASASMFRPWATAALPICIIRRKRCDQRLYFAQCVQTMA